MKAVRYLRKHSLEMIDTPMPAPEKPEDVVLKVLGCGICGTDGHIYKGEVPVAEPPVVLGHEICGKVVAWGDRVEGLSSGDKVCIDPIIGCSRCEYCRSGRSHFCGSMTNIGFARGGGFQQYTTVPASHVHPIPDHIDTRAAILIETLACVVNGYDQLKVTSGSSVMILGAGSVGLLWSQLISNSVKIQLLQTEVAETRRKVAEKLGADITINPRKEKLAEVVRDTMPDGLDYIIDATGSSAAIQEALPLLRKGGTFMIFGICPPTEKLSIIPFEIFEHELSIISSKMLSFKMSKAIKIVQSGLIETDVIVNRIMSLEELEDGLQWVVDDPDKSIKMMVDPWR